MALVKLNRKGIGELLRSNEVRAFITPLGERVLAYAKATAPVSTGAYRDSLHIEQLTTDRVVVRVVAAVPYAMLVEADNGTLGRALDAAR